MKATKSEAKGHSANYLSLVIEADSLSAADFRKAADAFTRLVEEVTKGVLGEDRCPPDAWKFTLEKGSFCYTATANTEVMPAKNARAVTSAITDGLESLNESPYGAFKFDNPQKAYKPIARIGNLSIARDKSTSIKMLRGTNKPTTTVTLSEDMSGNAKKAATAGIKDYYALGAVEGIVDVITLREPAGIRLSHIITKRNVDCIFSDEELKDKAKSLFGKRVEIEGLIIYSGDGYPKSIKVETIRKLPGPGESPDPSLVVGILKEAK